MYERIEAGAGFAGDQESESLATFSNVNDAKNWLERKIREWQHGERRNRTLYMFLREIEEEEVQG